MSFKSLDEIVKRCKDQNKDFFEVILEDDMKERHVTREESLNKMSVMYESMKKAHNAYDARLHSQSGLVGGDGAKMLQAAQDGTLLSGNFIGQVMASAIMMGESNACMKRIVAAPTAGSCGVVPAVFLTIQKQQSISDEKMVQAMYVVAGIGQVIATRAFISGAEGGCQAEIGSASAMAAGGLTYLKGGDPTVICHSSAMALKNLLGLACDPVAGLVEVPCVKRNVIGAINAISCTDMAIAGLTSAIPPDEVIDAMREIGINMPLAIRETGEGGLAGTRTGCKIKESLEHY
ncbi:L-serine dehydratase, alpha subunit [Lachnospiraceae bacterium KM106-2]|nr:L-serine dehydratase, alpha subunit [Lachnospiraceae bacterium KM106-2]